MKIGINLLYLIPGMVGGTEIYASGLLFGMVKLNVQHEFVVYVNEEGRRWPLPEVANIRRIVCPVSAVRRWRRYVFEQIRLPVYLKNDGVEIVHSLGYVSPLFAPCASVVTIHDLNYKAFGRHMPSVRRATLNFFVKQSAHRACRVITVSEFSRIEICRSLRLPLDRVAVTYEASRFQLCRRTDSKGANEMLERLNIRSPYILSYSISGPNKNIARLVQAFRLAKAEYKLPHQLVLVGRLPRKGKRGPPIQWAPDESVLFTGYLDDSALSAVLGRAEMVVLASTYEGFGLPIVEAMAMGVPVVCSDRASLPEVAGTAGVFFNPFSVKDMAQKMGQVALDPKLREAVRLKGFENVKRFSWVNMARKTLEVYGSVRTGAGN